MGVGLSCTDLETMLMLLLLTKSHADFCHLGLSLIQGSTYTKVPEQLITSSRYHRILQKRTNKRNNIKLVTRLP